MLANEYRIPLNLQFFADDSGGNGDGANGDGKPSYEDLVKELAAQKAEYEKLKRMNDTNSSQAAEYKKQLRNLMDDEQRKEAERNDADAANKQELENLRKEVSQMKAVEKYRKMGMDEALALETATAEIEGDQDKVTACFEKHIKAVKASEYQRFLDERKEPSSGRGDQKNTAAEDYAKKAAGSRNAGANQEILNQYMIGGN